MEKLGTGMVLVLGFRLSRKKAHAFSIHSFSIFSVRRKKQAIYSKEQGCLASQQFEREESGLPKCCQDPSICSFVKLEQDSLMPCDVVEKWGRKMIVPSQHSKDW